MKIHSFFKVSIIWCILPTITLIWGFAMARYELFPYQQLLALKQSIVPSMPSKHIPSIDMPHWKMDVSHFEKLDTRPDIVMLGDSITASAEWTELFPTASIINRGISKDTTMGLLERIDEVAERMPKAVFILIGINDIGTGENVETIFSNYMQIIDYFEERGIKTFVQSTILPGKQINNIQHRKVLDLNKRLTSYCEKKSMSSFIDLNKVLAPSGVLMEQYTLDGIHLSGPAYASWAECIANTIKEIEVANK